ncbi:MAG: hypothetical protein LUQ65_13135, partial [Candidatus Helarchaeota archaeon]|nr:hypothetical protein [Candidatus Helarchaeota archaeon]
MIRRFIPLILSFGLLVVLWIVVFGLINPTGYQEYFIYIIPGAFSTDLILIYSIPVLIFLLCYWLSPYLAIFYIKLHQFFSKIIRRPTKYGITTMGNQITGMRIIYRAAVMSLFAFSFAALFVGLGYGEVFRPSFYGDIDFVPYEQILLGTLFICLFVPFVFFPIWLLEDSGVVSYRNYPDYRMPVDIEGVHSIYLNILMGYTGLSTIISLITYISNAFRTIPLYSNTVTIIVVLVLLPFLYTGVFLLPIYLYERFF